MASPRPAPGPPAAARWKRSKSRGRSAAGIPGPLSSTVRLTRLPWAWTLILTWPRPGPLGPLGPLGPGPGVPAGVVHQHARQPVDPLRRRADQGGPAAGVRGDLGPDGAEAVGAGLGQDGQVDRLVAGRRRPGVEPGQPQHVVDQLPQPAALGLDPAQRVAVLRGIPGAGQGHVGFGPDHAERRAQLVRGVGGELQLAAAGLLDRRQRAQPHDQCAEEHGQQQHRPGDELGVQQQPRGMRVAGPALARDQPVGPVAGQLEQERAGAAHLGREGQALARRVRGQQPGGQRGRARAVSRDRAGRADPPQEDRRGVGVHVVGGRGRSRRGRALAEDGRVAGRGGQPGAQVVLALRGLVHGEQHVEDDRADDVEHGDDRGRGGRDLGRGAEPHDGIIR